MSALIWEEEAPELRSPIMICAFRGWNDAAAAASTALDAVANELEQSRQVAHIDPEEFFDFQVSRPSISLVDGEVRAVEWPRNDLIAAPVEGADHDLVILDGTEPNLRWRGFTEAVMEAAAAFGVERVVTLGSLMAEVAHTMPVPITALASDPDIASDLDLRRSDYEGPTGITGVVHDACRRAGIPSASLWAAVPHYVAAVANPKAALALLIRLEALTGVDVDTTELEDECQEYEEQVGRAVAANEEIGEMVERIEAEQAEQLDQDDEIPTAEALASEFQRFLRDQRN